MLLNWRQELAALLCFAKGLRMEGLQQNPEPRGPAAQRPAAGAAVEGRDRVLPRPGQRHGGLVMRGCCFGPGLTKAPLPPAPDNGGASPEQGLGAAPPAPGACGGLRAPLVLLEPGVLGDRVARALCHAKASVPGVPRPGSARGASEKGAPGAG